MAVPVVDLPPRPGLRGPAKVILGLYQGFYQGEPLRAGDRILSFDAKPQINARSRLHPTPARRARQARPLRDRYNQTARPFSWKFTASDLHSLMDRISRHEKQDDPQDERLLEAA